ncbi:MAG: hypothetical protein HY717_05690 [Planctomycetes bacterium]|nr:hypothetical protein [Planctomycetota bacterium]
MKIDVGSSLIRAGAARPGGGRGMLWLAALLGALSAAGLGAGAAAAQDPVLYSLTGSRVGEQLGIALAPLNDIDGDGAPDFVAGADRAYSSDSMVVGYVHLVSGRTGAILRTWRGEQLYPSFGQGLCAFGDLDGDRKTDFAVESAFNEITVFSAATGGKLLVIDTRLHQRPDSTSFSFTASPDLNGDGVPDLILGDADYNGERPGGSELNIGRLSAYSGKDGKLLWNRKGDKSEDGLGHSVAALDDLDGDGLGDIAAGMPRGAHAAYESARTLGEVRFYRGKDGSLLHRLGNYPHYFNFGEAILNCGDLDGDGRSELAIAAPGYAAPPGFLRGWVGIYSTRTLTLLREFTGMDPEIFRYNFQGDALGFRLSSAGDADGDGVPDLLLAAERWSSFFDFYGRIDLRSGRTGKLLASYEVAQHDGRFLGSLAPLGDVDGDGRSEFLVGAWNYPVEFDCFTHPGACSGTVFALRYQPDQPLFRRGDANGDGRVNIVDAIAIIRRLYQGGGDGGCPAALDADGDGEIALVDAARLVRHFFRGDLAPAPPFPECGRFGGLRRLELPCERSSCPGE